MGREVQLGGLDGANPLGFLAALGTLRVADAGHREAGGPRPRLRWNEAGGWRPVLSDGSPDIPALVELVVSDLAAWREAPELDLVYTKSGEGAARNSGKGIRDIKAPPAVMRALLADAAARAAAGDARMAVTVSAWATDVAVDGAGFAKPTALHFTAGQQQFLKMARDLVQNLSTDDVERALRGPWKRESKLPSFTWDATTSRLWALRASDPSAEKRGSEPGAEWLAFLGLSYLPVAPRGTSILTTCVSGGWKDGRFTWPLWTVPATSRVIRSLLRLDLSAMTPRERTTRGIGAVFSSAITRSDQGGYGGFSPSAPA